MEPGAETAEPDQYQGPAFDDLDLSVQEGFYNYLEEVAGINDDFSDKVCELAESREEVEYCRWLDEVHEFVATQQAE